MRYGSGFIEPRASLKRQPIGLKKAIERIISLPCSSPAQSCAVRAQTTWRATVTLHWVGSEARVSDALSPAQMRNDEESKKGDDNN